MFYPYILLNGFVPAQNAMPQLTRNNHFVQQSYLRRWSTDASHVWEYATLAPHANYPEWRRAPIKTVAKRTDLYTSIEGGSDSDRFETWMNKEFENPATGALTKLVADQSLTKSDWERVAYYVAAQHLRTPASYLEQKERWEQTIPALIDKSLERAAKKVASANRRGKRILAHRRPVAESFPLRITFEPDSEGDLIKVSAEITAGRQLWLHQMRVLLTSTARELVRHKWSVMTPHSGMQWFTSDNPVLCLNYYGDDSHDFKGGWGNPGSEILFPLSPNHLLYTKVRYALPDRLPLSADGTFRIQQLLAKRAHRAIYAREPIKKVRWFRPRHIDAASFKAEREAWDRWHAEQSAEERK